jgi:hypothetical protein
MNFALLLFVLTTVTGVVWLFDRLVLEGRRHARARSAVADLERRAARLLPALFLARVDGKSPVEYVTDENDKARVRRVAVPLIASPPLGLADVRDAWAKEIEG